MESLNHLQLVEKVKKILTPEYIAEAPLNDLELLYSILNKSSYISCPVFYNDPNYNIYYSTREPTDKNTTENYIEKVYVNNSCDSGSPEVYNVYKYTFKDNISVNDKIDFTKAVKYDIVFDWRSYDDIPESDRITFIDTIRKWNGPDITNEDSRDAWSGYEWGERGNYTKLTALEYLAVYIKINYSPALHDEAELTYYIYSQKVKGKDPVILYRGIREHEVTMGIEKHFIDARTVGIYAHGYETSWTTNPCIAECFADSNGKSQIIKYTAKPEDILIDLRYLPDSQRKMLSDVNQSEVILKGGTYKVDVIKLYGDIRNPFGGL